MRPTFTPGAGTISNCVTTGPVVRPAMVPVHLEGPQRLEQHLPESVELGLARVDVPPRRFLQQLDRRKLRFDVRDRRRRQRFRLDRLGLTRLPGPRTLGHCLVFLLVLVRRREWSHSTGRGGGLLLLRFRLPLETLQGMPGNGEEGQGRERQEAEEQGAGEPDDVVHAGRQEARGEPRHPRAEFSSRDIRHEIVGRDATEHSHDIGYDDAEPGGEDRRPLHVEAGQPVEAGEPQPQSKERNAQRPDPEPGPEEPTQRITEGSSQGHGKQGEPGKEAEDQGGDCAEAAAGVVGHRRLAGAGAAVTRRS